MAKTSRKPVDVIASKRALARLVGRSASTVRKWTADNRWPFAINGPWPMRLLPDIKAWARMYLSHDPAQDYHQSIRAAAGGGVRAATPMEQARLACLVERAMLLKQRRTIEAGKLHDVQQCQQRRVQQIHQLKGRMLEWPRALANSLAMQPADAIERILAAQVAAVLEDFARG